MSNQKNKLIWEKKRKDVYFAYDEEGESIGRLGLEWVGRHLHWCWYQYEDARMTPGMVEELRKKQKELFNKRKKK